MSRRIIINSLGETFLDDPKTKIKDLYVTESEIHKLTEAEWMWVARIWYQSPTFNTGRFRLRGYWEKRTGHTFLCTEFIVFDDDRYGISTIKAVAAGAGAKLEIMQSSPHCDRFWSNDATPKEGYTVRKTRPKEPDHDLTYQHTHQNHGRPETQYEMRWTVTGWNSKILQKLMKTCKVKTADIWKSYGVSVC